jgi:hypothetical protein
MATVTRNSTPQDLLDSFRGQIVEARPAYPETIQLRLADADGRAWWLVTWDAKYTPFDPPALIGKTVVGVSLDGPCEDLRLEFTDGTGFGVRPSCGEREGDDDPANWQIFTPDGVVLTYGPENRWTLGLATDPA